MKIMLPQIIEYIYNISKNNPQLDDIYIFVNQYNIENLNLINNLVNTFRTVNIITSNVSKFKILENKYEKENILITVSNNRRKSACRANFIINVDLKTNDFENYRINNKAIIINLSNEKNIIGKNFNGVIINDFNVEISKNELMYINEFYGNINPKLFIESMIKSFNQNIEYKILYKSFAQKKIVVKEIIGIRGIINNKEIALKNTGKHLTKLQK